MACIDVHVTAFCTNLIVRINPLQDRFKPLIAAKNPPIMLKVRKLGDNIRIETRCLSPSILE